MSAPKVKKTRTVEDTTVEEKGRRVRHLTLQDVRYDEGDDAPYMGGNFTNANLYEDNPETLVGDESADQQTLTIQDIINEFSVPKERCWGCENAFHAQRQPGKNPVADQLWDSYSSNMHSQGPEQCAKLLAKFFEEEVYEKALERGEDCLFWSEEQILRHIQHHRLDPDICMQDTLREVDLLTKKIRNKLVALDGTPIEKNVRSYKEITKLKLDCIAHMKRYSAGV